MRKNLHIALYFISAIFTCMLLSCAGSKEEVQDTATMVEYSTTPIINDNKLEEAFETDTLSDEQLNVFQQRARQKVQDFINYIEIISNKTYDAQMRLLARNQIEELFADSSVLVTISIAEGKINPKPVSVFLNDVYQSEYDSIKIKTDFIVVTQPKIANETATYIGFIRVKLNIVGYKNAQISFNSHAVHEAKTIIRKTQKHFGEESRMIWTVMLGEWK